MSVSTALWRYTGIGSRETPNFVLDTMRTLASYLASHKFLLRSGGADGADKAFESGCDAVTGPKEIFIPWERFNGSRSSLYVPHPDAYILAAHIHPKWDKLHDPIKQLHARNMHQVLGPTLTEPSEFVVCWTSDGAETEAQTSIKTGGTASAIRLASQCEIPVFNLANDTSLLMLAMTIEAITGASDIHKEVQKMLRGNG